MTRETKNTALEQFAIALYQKGLLIGNGDWMQDVLEEFKKTEKDIMLDLVSHVRNLSYLATSSEYYAKLTDGEMFDKWYNDKFAEVQNEE